MYNTNTMLAQRTLLNRAFQHFSSFQHFFFPTLLDGRTDQHFPDQSAAGLFLAGAGDLFFNTRPGAC